QRGLGPIRGRAIGDGLQRRPQKAVILDEREDQGAGVADRIGNIGKGPLVGELLGERSAPGRGRGHRVHLAVALAIGPDAGEGVLFPVARRDGIAGGVGVLVLRDLGVGGLKGLEALKVGGVLFLIDRERPLTLARIALGGFLLLLNFATIRS